MPPLTAQPIITRAAILETPVFRLVDGLLEIFSGNKPAQIIMHFLRNQQSCLQKVHHVTGCKMTLIDLKQRLNQIYQGMIVHQALKVIKNRHLMRFKNRFKHRGITVQMARQNQEVPIAVFTRANQLTNLGCDQIQLRHAIGGRKELNALGILKRRARQPFSI